MKTRLAIAFAAALLQVAMMWPTLRVSPSGNDYHCLRLARDARTWSDALDTARCSGEFRPVSYATVQLAGVRLVGVDWFPYRVAILACQAISAALVVVLAAALTGSTLAGALAGAIYATSPISPRGTPQLLDVGNVLAVLFSIAAMLAFLRSLRPGARVGWRVASVGFYLFAMGSKETAIPLGGVLFLLAVRAHWPSIQRAVLAVAPHMVVAIGFCALSLWTTPGRAGYATSFLGLLRPALERSIATAGGSVFWGTANLFRLLVSFDSPVDVVILGILAAVALWLFWVAPSSDRWAVTLNLAWALLSFVPGLFAYPGYGPLREFSERALFPLIPGAAIAGGVLGARLVVELRLTRQASLAVGCTLLVLLCTRGAWYATLQAGLCPIPIGDGQLADRIIERVMVAASAIADGEAVCTQNTGLVDVRWMGDAVALRSGRRLVPVVPFEALAGGVGPTTCAAVVVIPAE